MEKGTQRALKRDGHKTLLIDDGRASRLIGRKLAQKWALSQARRFKPDFVILSKCLGLDLDTVREIVDGKSNAMWYQEPQWYKSTYRPDIAHIVAVGKLSQTFSFPDSNPSGKHSGCEQSFSPRRRIAISARCPKRSGSIPT